ncbi:MAG: GGDEF domain-containing protein [Gammaproteobacteria bacterium]
MKTLFSLSTVVEPDRQRLVRFAVDVVRSLGGNLFAAVAALNAVLDRLREANAASDVPLQVILGCDVDRVLLCWGEMRHELTRLRDAPEPRALEALAQRLRKAGESTDPELLRRRNHQIAADLERAKQRAAQEMAELESMLERKKEELQESIHLAETDSLTGLLNRGAYDDRLRTAVLRCSRQHEELSLILLDLDKFKAINDTHGHQYGDAYLQRMAGAMCAAIRQHVDIACRMGGDEFAIIALCAAPVALRIAERVVASMDGKVSAGIAQLVSNESVVSLVARADAALYDAKRSGRGRVNTATNQGTELGPKGRQ